MNIATLLYATAQATPRHPAVTDVKGSLTYEQLASRTKKIAHNLIDEVGLSQRDKVVVCMDNCVEFIEVLFACWSAGLTVVPVNSKLHSREVRYIVEDSQARLCIATDNQWQALVSEIGDDFATRIINVASPSYTALSDGNGEIVTEVSSEEAAWVFYTSGTTGRPKGAVISHGALLFMTMCYFADIDFVSEDETQLHVAPLSHAAGLYALPHIAKGGHQVVLSAPFAPAEVFAAIEHYPHVSMFVAPTMLTRLIDSPEAKNANVENIKTIVYGGGPMPLADLKRAITFFGPKLYQIYGQGEAPMSITGVSKRHHSLAGDSEYESLLKSVGTPRTGVEVKVVGPTGLPLPAHEIGEILTRSSAMMSGYLGKKDNPFRDGWLATGDLGSIDESGFLTLHGRSKEMIVSGGSNVYPREVEDVLLRHPSVSQCAVVGRPSEEWGEEVVAFVVPATNTTISFDELDGLCLDNIARFKRPREYFVVESLPTNDYGKLVRNELRQILMKGPNT